MATHLFVELWILVEELEGLTDAVIHVPKAGQRRLSLSCGLQDILDDNPVYMQNVTHCKKGKCFCTLAG